jgi:hypothetical protein
MPQHSQSTYYTHARLSAENKTAKVPVPRRCQKKSWPAMTLLRLELTVGFCELSSGLLTVALCMRMCG